MMTQTFNPKSEFYKLRGMLDFIAEKVLPPDQLAEFQERFSEEIETEKKTDSKY